MALARNDCIDLIRKEKKNRHESLDQLAESSAGEAFVTDRGSGSETASNKEFVQKMLSQLPENYRDILILREIYGFSYEDLTTILSLTLDGVKSQIRRARARAEEVARHLMAESNVSSEKEQLLPSTFDRGWSTNTAAAN
jgi:RNA polymerase sigma-70 factor (ECF subfamily)